MSLFAALTVAVGGLNAQSSAIGNISDNLSNAQTTGFKGINTQFESLVTQSNAFANDPGGVRATPAYQNGIQGNLVQSQSATALAISGQGFFPVRPAVVGADGTTTFSGTTYYTRAGDFSLNKSGYLVNGAGLFLTGYDVDTSGNVDSSQAVPIQIAALLDNPVATSTVTYAANLPASAVSTVADVFTSSPSTIQVYDKLGAKHNLGFTWEKQASNEFDASAVILDSNGITINALTTGTFGNDITITLAAGSTSGTKATVSVTGQADEVYDNIAGSGATFWTNLETAINASSRLVTATAGSGTDGPTLGAYPLTGGTGDRVNFTATATIGTSDITFDALDTGLAGNDITVTIADGTTSGKKVTITDGTTTETYDNIAGSGATLWTNVAAAVNGGGSALVMATAGGGTGAASNGTTTLADGLEPLPDNNLWFLNVSVPDGGGLSGSVTQDYTAKIPFYFNSTTTSTATAGTIRSIGSSTSTGASGTYTATTAGVASLTIPLDFSGLGVTGTQNIVVDLGVFGSSSGGVTQFADTTVSVSSFEQNGIPRGSFQSLSIDKNGFVALNYDNGQNRTISQIPIVQFFAQDQLQRVTGGAFSQTLASGSARYSSAGSNGAGTIVGNSLEGSNVDIANEFTKLIQAQQIYSANAKTIVTSNDMLQQAINIIR